MTVRTSPPRNPARGAVLLSGPMPHFLMAKITNLNKARKARARDAKRATADENAVTFGRTNAEKRLEDTRAAKARRDLEGHRVKGDPRDE